MYILAQLFLVSYMGITLGKVSLFCCHASLSDIHPVLLDYSGLNKIAPDQSRDVLHFVQLYEIYVQCDERHWIHACSFLKFSCYNHVNSSMLSSTSVKNIEQSFIEVWHRFKNSCIFKGIKPYFTECD